MLGTADDVSPFFQREADQWHQRSHMLQRVLGRELARAAELREFGRRGPGMCL